MFVLHLSVHLERLSHLLWLLQQRFLLLCSFSNSEALDWDRLQPPVMDVNFISMIFFFFLNEVYNDNSFSKKYIM